MPSFVTNLDERETVDLHAPWWSDEKDEDGRYKERAVVFAEMTEADDQWVQKQIMGSIKTPSSRKAAKNISMAQYAHTRTFLFLRMVRELTNRQGHPVRLSREVIESLSKRDSEWLAEQLEALYEPPVEVLEQDDEEAERNIERQADAPEATDPTLIAERHFRRNR